MGKMCNLTRGIKKISDSANDKDEVFCLDGNRKKKQREFQLRKDQTKAHQYPVNCARGAQHRMQKTREEKIIHQTIDHTGSNSCSHVEKQKLLLTPIRL